MGTDKTSNWEWDNPLYPSDNLPAELRALISQIDTTVANIPHSEITEKSSDDHHTRYQDGEAPLQSVNGKTGDVTIGTFSGSHNDLSDVASDDHHAKYTDAEASSAAPVQTVDGKTGNVTSERQQVLSMTTSSGQNINQQIVVNWDEHLVDGDTAFSHDPTVPESTVTIQEGGTYEIYANIYSDTDSGSAYPGFYFIINKGETTEKKIPTRSAVSRSDNSDGNNRISIKMNCVRELSVDDDIQVETFQEGGSGSCTLQNRRSVFTIKKMVR